jgi:hypothetical protein
LRLAACRACRACLCLERPNNALMYPYHDTQYNRGRRWRAIRSAALLRLGLGHVCSLLSAASSSLFLGGQHWGPGGCIVVCPWRHSRDAHIFSAPFPLAYGFARVNAALQQVLVGTPCSQHLHWPPVMASPPCVQARPGSASSCQAWFGSLEACFLASLLHVRPYSSSFSSNQNEEVFFGFNYLGGLRSGEMGRRESLCSTIFFWLPRSPRSSREKTKRTRRGMLLGGDQHRGSMLL